MEIQGFQLAGNVGSGEPTNSYRKFPANASPSSRQPYRNRRPNSDAVCCAQRGGMSVTSATGPQRRLHDGRWVVSRAWVMQHTGASARTVARWYGERTHRPEGRRFPEAVCTVDRVQYYDQQAVEAFWAAWQQDVGTGRLQRAGRSAGDGRTYSGGRSRKQREQAVAVVLAELRRTGGYERGLAARLAREHGGVARKVARMAAVTCCDLVSVFVSQG